MNAATTLAASVQAKKGRLYAVIQVRENGKTKPVWRALGLPESANKSKVNKAYREVVQAFEQSYAEQIAQNKKLASDIPIYDYMCAYYKKIEKNIQKSTAESYRGMINGRIRRYFTARKDLAVGSITAKDIEDFYEWMFESGVVANTVIHYHTVLHSAFKRAFKDGLIDSNPFDRIDRPKKNKFTGENYSEEELISMLGLIRGDVIYPAVMLAGGLGLRRSEALGARWSRVPQLIQRTEDGRKSPAFVMRQQTGNIFKQQKRWSFNGGNSGDLKKESASCVIPESFAEPCDTERLAGKTAANKVDIRQGVWINGSCVCKI